jgi:hypothetical protein
MRGRLKPLIRGLGVLLCLLLITTLRAGEVNAFLDRDTMLARETVTLTLEIDAPAGDVDVDLEPLKRDFAILGTQVNTELQLLNNRQSAKTRWRIELEPKRSGVLRVPPLRVGSEQTAALSLTVQAQPSVGAQPKAGADLLIEVQAEPSDPYVQSQIRYTARLLSALSLREGNLTGPAAPHAVVEKLGDDAAYETTRHGRRYQVFERRYAIFPQQSGELTIPALRFQGWVTSDDRHSLFSSSRRQPVALDGDTVKLTVRPRPAEFNGSHWLPSEALSLHAGWSSAPPRFRVGEPITRTLILEAKGLGASQLPELSLPILSWARSYEDQPLKEDRNDGGWRMGRREQRQALVPTTPGRFTLPEIRLEWWDTRQDQPRSAVIPAVDIDVLAAPGQPATPGPPVPQTAQRPTYGVELLTTPMSGSPNAGVWPWLTALLFLIWLITLLAWRHSARLRASAVGAAEHRPSGSARAAERAVRTACVQNDATGAAKALLQWASIVWPAQPPRSLGALALHLGPHSRTWVQDLDQALYAPPAGPWQGEPLGRVVKQGLLQTRLTLETRPQGPAPLYPERSGTPLERGSMKEQKQRVGVDPTK